MTGKMIVLAGLGRVKAFRITPDMMTSKPQMELVYDCEFPDAHHRLKDLVTDMAGGFPVSGKPGTSIGENHNLRVETERRLIRQVAEKIGELARGQRCWYLAAAENINGRIIELLSPEVRAALFKNVTADLVKTRKQEVLDHFMASA
jgi:hypothetical protein